MQKREQLCQVIQNDMKLETDKAARAGLPQPYDVMAADTNAALFTGDVQRTELDGKDIRHQNFVKAVCLHTTESDRQPHRQYTFRHTTECSQDSRIDDILISESMCTEVLPSTEILNTSGDADHAPVLAKLPLTCMNFVKPGPDPIPLPREPRLKTPVPQENLKEFKETFDQETGASTTNLLYELDSTSELAYTIAESLSQSESLKETLTSVSIGNNTVEHFDCLLQAILQQVLPIARRICKFSKEGPASGIRLKTRCTCRKLEGLSKSRKGLHKVAMHHRGTKPEGEEACNKMRDLVQTEQGPRTE